MTGNTWEGWVYAAGTSTTSANCTLWGTWTADSGTAASSGPTWKVWTSGCVTTGITDGTIRVWGSWVNGAVAMQPWKPAPPTEAELERRRVEAERWRVEAEQRQAEQKAAGERADALLAEFLDAMQRGQFKTDLAFMVQSETGKTYRIKRGWSHNVEELDADGKAVASYCIHPLEDVPYGDNLLAQKLMLETNEAEFLRVANRMARVHA